jgi:hypothetical protein
MSIASEDLRAARSQVPGPEWHRHPPLLLLLLLGADDALARKSAGCVGQLSTLAAD